MKHNKTWYNNRIAQATVSLELLQREIEDARKSCKTIEDNDALNQLYDRELDAKADIRFLEFDRDTRNWTHQDWTLHNLIARNID